MATRKTTSRKTARKTSSIPPEPASFKAAVQPSRSLDNRDCTEYLITVVDGADVDAIDTFANVAGLQNIVSTMSMSADEIASETTSDSLNGVMLARLGIAAVKLDPDQYAALKKSNGNVFVAIEPAPVFYALGDLPPQAYLQGWRDCADALLKGYAGSEQPQGEQTNDWNPFNSNRPTWGLDVTGVVNSGYNGEGIRVAILDTGLDLQHPDFLGRNIIHESFIPGEAVDDGNSHGTHCAGTACGPQRPRRGGRYGIAWGAELHIGKVLSNAGGSRGRSVPSGMEWALAKQCHIISMSLGSAVLPGTAPTTAYERLGTRALASGSLIIAAAGNDSDRRRGIIHAVSSPANCSTIFSVGAVDSGLNIAGFSNGGLTLPAGAIDLAAPGVDIDSSIPGGGRDKKNGTSMATPHVAGIAALWAQATGRRGQELWNQLLVSARDLPLDRRDVGAGLVQAP